MANITMQCADENFAEREFAPADDEGDYVCLTCGWMQTSAAAGAAELCMLATWHSVEEYNRFAAVARAAGHNVPPEPPHFKE